MYIWYYLDMEVGLSDDMPVDCITGEDKSNLNFIT